ncbi:AAA family ATPase [Porphyromonas miyakawae]|uniref:AAA family ATPase n=1 Tax=Porphyromonas miyakawae TaxID=3137470 RepID=A0ABQ0DZM5_9PORP
MIKKFLKINNLGVFKDFEWDKNVVSSQGKPVVLGDINIFFGRNYSGKTTISRIFRAFELKGGLEKYESGAFKLELSDGNTIDEKSIANVTIQVRVFNEDFVKDNLLFIANPEEGVTPFAVLGENAQIESEIQELKIQLGSAEEGNESGLYLERMNAVKDYQEAEKEINEEKGNLERKLKFKALNKSTGIKYLSQFFGDQNYNVAKLADELKKVNKAYRLSDEQISELKASLKEEVKQIPHISEYFLPSFEDINQRIKAIVEQPIMASGKIEELVRNAIANKWVEEGCKLHEGKKICLFCGGEITKNRWAELEHHYDEATRNLKNKAKKEVDWLEGQIQVAKELYKISPDQYYQHFKAEVESINKDMDKLREILLTALNGILLQVKKKLEEIHSTPSYIEHTFDFSELYAIYNRIEELEKSATEYGTKLKQEKSKTQEKLRLSEVSRFKEDIDFEEIVKIISEKEAVFKEKEVAKKEKEEAVFFKEQEIKAKERLRQNEEEGAKKVNAVLKNYFGHRFIELRAVKKDNEEGVYFDVFRGEQKAYNLSEGERNLVAFAYFVAKLQDVETASEKPIIWIDDPISSLDANHVFFIFSLIDQQIVAKRQWTQLFISTHNLDFLRYLKRLHTKELTIPYLDKKGDIKQRDIQIQRFLLERQGSSSIISVMPKYMKEHVTEFNYLFHQIYKCSQATENENYELFYNFGNNARKFLEAYLYYKYPDNEKNCLHKKMTRFFSDGYAATTIGRIDNELSHLEGLMERGMSVSDHAEIKKCAKFILETIKKKDPDQYGAFLESIGERETD